MPTKKGQDECRKWYWTWGKLCNGHTEPESPYANPYELLDRFVQLSVQLERGPEIQSALLYARSIFAGLQDARQSTSPARSEDDRGTLGSSVAIDEASGETKATVPREDPTIQMRAPTHHRKRLFWLLILLTTSHNAFHNRKDEQQSEYK